MSGISQSQLSRILSFDKDLTLDQCEELTVLLGIPIYELFDLATDQRVWGTNDEVVVDGRLIAADPLSREEVRNLVLEHTSNLDKIRKASPSLREVHLQNLSGDEDEETPVGDLSDLDLARIMVSRLENKEELDETDGNAVMPLTAVAYNGPDEDAQRGDGE